MRDRTKRNIVQSVVAALVAILSMVGLAAPASATSQNGQHTSGIVWTLGGARYETYLGAGPVLSDGGHWDSWSSVRWPQGGDKRFTHRRHYGGQVAPASSTAGSASVQQAVHRSGDAVVQQATVVKRYGGGYLTSTVNECRYVVNGDVVGTYRDEFGRFWYVCIKR